MSLAASEFRLLRTLACPSEGFYGPLVSVPDCVLERTVVEGLDSYGQTLESTDGVAPLANALLADGELVATLGVQYPQVIIDTLC